MDGGVSNCANNRKKKACCDQDECAWYRKFEMPQPKCRKISSRSKNNKRGNCKKVSKSVHKPVTKSVHKAVPKAVHKPVHKPVPKAVHKAVPKAAHKHVPKAVHKHVPKAV